MKKIRTIFLVISFAYSLNCRAEEPRINLFVPPDKFSGLDKKNDIDVKTLTQDFEKNFAFVSAHYRDDKNEIRLIYGNKLAIKGMESKNSTYEEGAVFYKVVYDAQRDPSFEASLISKPRPKVRQVMIYNQKKYQKFGGWGYAVFNDDGVTLPGDPEQTNSTCYACHNIVANRNYVFSFLTFGISPSDNSKKPSPPDLNKKSSYEMKSKELFGFKEVELTTVNPEIRRIFHTTSTKMSLMNGKLMSEGFTGFIPELLSFLFNETVKTDRPSLALKEISDEMIFSYAYIDHDTTGLCPIDQKTVRLGSGNVSAKVSRKNTHIEQIKCALVSNK